MSDSEHVALALALFAAWSSGDADAPRAYLTDDAVLDDVIGGVHHGWADIRAYFQQGLDRYPDLTLVPTGEFWHRPDGVALTWVMSAAVTDDALGPGARGLRWAAPGTVSSCSTETGWPARSTTTITAHASDPSRRRSVLRHRLAGPSLSRNRTETIETLASVSTHSLQLATRGAAAAPSRRQAASLREL